MNRTSTIRRHNAWRAAPSILALAALLFGGDRPLALAGPGPLSRDIDTYVLFAYESLNFKGRDANPLRGFITGGNVGVNIVDPTPNNSSRLLNMGGGGSAHVVVMSDGTQANADSMNLGGSDVSVWEAYSNYPSLSTAMADIRNPPLTGFAYANATEAIIAAANLPALPTFAPGAVDVVVPKNGSLNLAPGNYRDAEVKDDGTINLGAGIYNFRNFVNGRDVTINTVAGTIVQVEGDFSVNNSSFIGGSDLAQFLVGSVGVGANDSSISFGRNTEAHGQFFAPLGILNLGHSTDLFGRFWAKEINSDFNVNVTYVVPEPSSACSAAGGIVLLLGAWIRRRAIREVPRAVCTLPAASMGSRVR